MIAPSGGVAAADAGPDHHRDAEEHIELRRRHVLFEDDEEAVLMFKGISKHRLRRT